MHKNQLWSISSIFFLASFSFFIGFFENPVFGDYNTVSVGFPQGSVSEYTPNVSVSIDKTSYSIGDSITISGNSQSNYFFEELTPATKCRVVDAYGNFLDAVSIDQQIQITCDVVNVQDREQTFAYLVQIKNSDHHVVSLAWITGSLSSGQSFSPALSWIPENSGVYLAEVFLFNSLDNLIPLSRSDSTFVKVDTSESLPNKPPRGEGAFRSVIMKITEPSGIIAVIDQITPKSIGTFSKKYSIGGSIDKIDSSYVVSVNQASAKDTTQFSLTKPIGPTNSDVDAQQIDITTDKHSYFVGETIFVSGKVSEILQGTPVNVQVISPNGNLKNIQQITVGPDKKFSSEIFVGGPLWKAAGEYMIRAVYGTENITDEISFTLTPEPEAQPEPESEQQLELLEPEPQLESPEPTCDPGTELVNGICQTPKTTEGPDTYSIWIILGIVIGAGIGVAGFAISRSRKPSTSGTITKTVSGNPKNGRECNVCGTIIPEGKSVCPSCGDTYS